LSTAKIAAGFYTWTQGVENSFSKRIICLDVGDRSIGVAISDSSNTIARGMCVIRFPYPSSLEEKADRIKEVILATDAGKVLIGMPLDLKGKEGKQAEKVKEFAKILKGKVKVPVIFADERFTTLQAERILKEGGLSISKRKKLKDKVAATILLQNYLDFLRNQKLNGE